MAPPSILNREPSRVERRAYYLLRHNCALGASGYHRVPVGALASELGSFVEHEGELSNAVIAATYRAISSGRDSGVLDKGSSVLNSVKGKRERIDESRAQHTASARTRCKRRRGGACCVTNALGVPPLRQ